MTAPFSQGAPTRRVTRVLSSLPTNSTGGSDSWCGGDREEAGGTLALVKGMTLRRYHDNTTTFS
jgi:hypothetical protein